MKKYAVMNKSFIYVFLLVGVFFSIIPFYWMFVGATNPSGEIFKVPPNFLPGNFLGENFHRLQESLGIVKIMWNSLVIALTYTFFSVLLCSAAGYAFAKFTFIGRKVIFFSLLLTIMIPYQVTLIPLFELMIKLDWLNTYKSVILPHLAYPFAIFLMRQNMQAIPDSLIEAARVDGAGEIRIFLTIVMPTMRPALAAVSIFLFMFQWNNFIWPLVTMNTPDMYTLPVALASLVGLARIDYGQLMLGTTLSTLPIIVFFLILQKQFISGILGGSVKE